MAWNRLQITSSTWSICTPCTAEPFRDPMILPQYLKRGGTGHENDISEDVSWSDDRAGTPSCFVGFFQTVFDKTATSLKSTSIITHYIYAVLLNCLVTYRRCINENQPSLTAVVIAQFTATIASDAKPHFIRNFAHYWFTSWNKAVSEATLTHLKQSNGRKLKTSMIHDAMSDLLAHFLVSERTPFRVSHIKGQSRSCLAIPFSYGCNIPEAKDKDAV